jgi:hypothetical protein
MRSDYVAETSLLHLCERTEGLAMSQPLYVKMLLKHVSSVYTVKFQLK